MSYLAGKALAGAIFAALAWAYERSKKEKKKP